MLSRILDALNEAGPVCAETLAKQLQKEPEVITGMLDELVHMGKVSIEGGGDHCEICQLRSLCGLPVASSPRYRLR